MKYILFPLLLIWAPSMAQVAIDGFFDDWTQDNFVFDDSFDEQGLDILKVYVSDDDQYLFIRVDCDRDFDLQDAEDMTIFIDADNDPNTGFEVGGIGSELSYYFGDRQGYLNFPFSFSSVNHAPMGMIALPTITSEKFEMSFKKSITYQGNTITMGDEISIYVRNGNNGDEVPNVDGGFEYTLEDNAPKTFSYDLNKTSDQHTRLMSYNVLQDGFQDFSQRPSLEAIIEAMNPDILALQEVYDTNPSQIEDFLNEAIPSSNGTWTYGRIFPDIMVFAKGYVEAWGKIDGNGVFLVYDEQGENPIIIYNVHLPCCANDFDRQLEVDHLLAVMRDREDAFEVDFSYLENTPVVITGDFNLVGDRQQYESLITGDIVNENPYGPDFSPDWDGTDLEDASPYVTGAPFNYTWNNPFGSYNPGRLDFFLYTGSVMSAQNAFTLETAFLSSNELLSLGLDDDDTARASDHLPIIVDFLLGDVDEDMDGYASSEDCDDSNAAINPGAIEVPNNDVDEDCDGTALVIDEDMDGFNSDEDCDDADANVNPAATEIANNDTDEDCDGELLIIDEDMDGYNSDEDCNDADANINPGIAEIPNNDTDEDCDGVALIIDIDMDGFNSDEDCNDTDPNINPDAVEIVNNNVDEDCDGEVFIIDEDMDGYNSDDDCNDSDPAINPGAEEIPNNGIDEDCNGFDEVVDIDMDGYDSNIDCDDENPAINPDAVEIANNDVDEDCDGELLIIDEDMDGFNSDEDCDDSNPDINPGVLEIANNDVDENCDGETLIIDEDMDGFNSDEDCDDMNPDAYPGAPEIANNDIDEDCDGEDFISATISLPEATYQFYPNPANDLLWLETDHQGKKRLDVYYAGGQLVETLEINKGLQSIDIQGLTSGVYFLCLHVEGYKPTMRRLVVLK